ncbi:zinc ribbon domain-containing protein [Luteibacter yeojuensis]|uniref:Zinc ribbon domain-containing protein n=1 Tax=Luteibacter yeojuensis TaxID=345309 RepID=A0A7X5TR09_9GAMM|nr:zinc ribbon domain-containing protein [Luteibacter yeojuensis]NID16384.1 zinc ribbon domain-containing protein [Luteibacter yeojuensis]
MSGLGMLVRCYEGMRNWRAFTLLAIAIVCGGMCASLAGALAMQAGVLFGGVGLLIAVTVYLAGINGAGLLLLDQADRRPLRGMGAAFLGGLHGTWTSFLAFLLLGLGLVCVVLAMYLLSLLTRIPGVGTLFAFLLAGPGAVALAFCYGLLAIGTPLMLVAVWRGAGVLGAIGRAVDIVVKRPLDALLHFVVLTILVVPVAVFVIGLLTLTSTLSLSIFSGGGAGSILGAMGGGYGYGGMRGPFDGLMNQLQSAGAASASIGVVMLVLVALFVLVGMFGYIMIHDSLGAGLDTHAEDRLRGGVSQIKRKLAEHRPQPQAAVQPTATAPARMCSSCGTRLQGDDRFCGDCGTPA